MVEGYDLAAVRKLLSDAFNAGEISTLAFDLFPSVYQTFAPGMDREQMIQRIVQYAGQNGKVPELLNYVQRENPYQYGRYAGQLEKNPSSQQQQLTPSPPASQRATPQVEPAEPLTSTTVPEKADESVPLEEIQTPPKTTSDTEPVVQPPVPAASNDKVNSTASRPQDVDKSLLLVAVAVVLVIMVVSALVLRFIFEIRDVSSLVILLLIELPFVLVVIGRLTGQDFIGWLGNLFQRT